MFVEVEDGARLYCELLGDAPGKPFMIVHHGGPGASSHAESKASFGFLADRFRVLVFDARGSGRSDCTGPYTHERWVADVEALRRWACVETFVIAGGSYGGFIALEYALAYAERVEAIILRDTAAHGNILADSAALAARSDRVKPDPARLERMFTGTMIDDADMEACLIEIAPLYAGSNAPPPTTRGGAPALGTNKELIFHAATHNAAFSQNLGRYDLRSRLPEIRVPTLVTVGRHDWITPVSCSEEIATGISAAELVVFEQSGHSPPADEPQAFQHTVRRFLDRVVPEVAS